MRPILPICALFVIAAAGCMQDRPAEVDAQPNQARSADLDEDHAPQPDFVVRSLDYLEIGVGKVFSAIADVPVRIWDVFHREKPSDAARQMENLASADDRRHGINELMQYSFARHSPYTDRYRQIGLLDPDPTVRAVAIRALNRSRDGNSTSVWQQALSDVSPLVRMEAAKALVHIPDADAATKLGTMLGDHAEDRDVRIAAADALQHYRTLPTARVLSVALSERDFAIAWQSRRSLRILTGRDYGYDQAAWLEYFTGPEKPF